MPKKKRGKSHSTRPISKGPPPWVKCEPEEVESLVKELGKQGVPPSKIGLILRDRYGIPLVKYITKKKVTQILRESGLTPSLPEDLTNLIRKADNLRKHLEKHKRDRKNVHSLELVEARIHNLAKYYKRKGIIPPDWKYEFGILHE
jgi:small subunit ribosomal protein S15